MVLVLASASLAGFAAAPPEQNAAPAESRIVGRVDDSSLVALKHTVHPLANARNDRGIAPDGMKLDRMHLVLTRSAGQETALRQLIGDMHTPGAASYHKWLTPEQFGKQFGPSDQDIAAVEAWLTGHGFSVTQVNPGKQTIEFSGNVGQLRSAFHTQIHKYEVNGESHYANATDPKIPAALAPVVGGFVALNNFHAKSYAKSLGKATYDPKTDKAKPEWTMGSNAAGNSFVLAPGDFAVQYDLNPLYKAGTNGTGQSIAIVNESNINIGLVNSFRTLFGLPANPPQVIIDGNDPGVDGINNPDGPNYASVEAYLDVEWAGAVAPNATVDLVIAADTDLESGLFLAAERAVYSNVAPIISLSFGNCESNLGSTSSFLNSLWEQAAAQGITVAVSTGDNGSANCDNDNTQEYAIDGLAVSGFASTPYNVAVGGTDFYYSDFSGGVNALNAQIDTYWNTTPSNNTPSVSIQGVIPEQPWNNSQYGLTLEALQTMASPTSTEIAAGSGGASTLYGKPAWQTGTGVPSDSARDLPDVSLFASSGANASYYPICYEDGDCQPVSSSGTVQIYGVGGTSASTPAFAGMMALVNQKYGRQGQADFVLYPLATQFPAAFHDVTAGTNTVPCDYSDATPNCIHVSNAITVTDPNLGTATEGEIGTGTTADYNATTGYDLASGLGTIDANQLVTNWGSVKFASTTTTLTPSQTTFAHGTSVTVSGAVTSGSGTPTGDVALLTASTEPNQQGQTSFTLSNGAYSGSTTTLPGGTYNIWGHYGGDSTTAASSSTPVQITVTPESSGMFFNVLTTSGGQISTVPSGSSGIPYGTQLTLSALLAPSSQLSALENCETNGGTCPVFTPATGTVAFSDGSTLLNTAVVNAEDEAEYTSPTTFNVGSHSVTAKYSGDQSYSSSTGSAITFSVVQSAPTVLIVSPQPSYNQGQTSTISILVEGLGNGAAPTGTVTISGAPAGTPASATLSAGVDPSYGTTVGLATVTIPASATSGSYNITATYNPTGASVANYGSATSGAYSLQILGAAGIATTTTASATSAATSPTAAVTVTGTVKAASGAAPTGSIYPLLSIINTQSGQAESVYLGVVTITPGSGTSSTFSFSVNSQVLLQGANQLTLQYGGNTNDLPSTALISIANSLSDFSLVAESSIVAVAKPGAAGSVAIDLTSINGFSGSVNLTATAASGIGISIPASVTLASGSTKTVNLALTSPAAGASGSYPVRVTAADSTGRYVHTAGLQFVVGGNAAAVPGFALTNSGAISIAQGATTGNTSTVSVTPSNGFTGSVALTCAVTGAPAAATSPVTCSVPATASVVGAAAATATLTVDSTATTTTGGYTVKVTGTSGSITSSVTVNVTVTAAAVPSFALTNSGAISVAQGATSGNTSTVTVTPSNGFTGSVALTCAVTTSPAGATSPVTCSVAPSTESVTGATPVTPTLTVASTSTTTTGAYAVTVTGTSGAITSSTTVNVTVTAAAAPTFALTNSGNISVSPGATSGNTSTITVTPKNSFTGAVSLSCSVTSSPSGAIDAPTCTLAPTSVSITAGALTSTLTVSTTAATSSMNRPADKPAKFFWPSAGGTALALVCFFGIPARRRRNWMAMLGLVVFFASIAAIGCGSGGSSGGGGNTGTTAGSYTVTVTGTSGTTTMTTPVTLTVQ